MPTEVATPRPRVTDQIWISEGKPMMSVIVFATRYSAYHADDSAEEGHGRRFDQELRHDVAAARAERLAHTDLARALGDRDQHDVHDDDAADDQRDSGERDEDGKEAGADALPDADEGLVGIDGEAVLCSRGVVADGAQDDAHLVRAPVRADRRPHGRGHRG